MITSASPNDLPPARLPWVDRLRGGATVLVFLLHASLVVELLALVPWPPLVAFNTLFSPYRMALLMLLSGLLLDRALRKDPVEFTRRKVSTLLYPYLLWTLVYGLAVHDKGLGDPRLWAGASYLWFILFLFSYFMVGLATRVIPVGLVILTAIALSLAAPDDTKYAETYFFLMSLFFIGQYLSRHPDWLAWLASPRLLPLTVPVAGALSALAVAQGDAKYKIELLGPTLAGIAVLVCLGSRPSRSALARGLDFIGRHSVVFFVLHYPLMYGVMAASLEAGLRSVPAITALSFGLVFVACWLVALLRERHDAVNLAFVLPLERLRLPRPA